jgi:catalase
MKAASGARIEADCSLEKEPGFLFDALALPDGKDAVAAVAKVAHTMDFIKDQFRHCKTILALGASCMLLEQAGLPLDGKDAGLVLADAAGTKGAIAKFIDGMAKHRHFERETGPPAV